MQNNELVSSLLLASQYEFLRAFIVGSTMSSLNIIFVNSLMLCVSTSSMWLPLCLHFISYSLIRAEQRAFCNFFLWLWLTATTVDHKTKQVSVCLAATEDSSTTEGCTRTGRHAWDKNRLCNVIRKLRRQRRWWCVVLYICRRLGWLQWNAWLYILICTSVCRVLQLWWFGILSTARHFCRSSLRLGSSPAIERENERK